ncbi:LIM and calponin homology domains-containing protein 1 isoform X10 [Crotalus tigris]|uniref:LIM and calponin homology domains-containing protein 1 isoform X10 n=1 Tax=Crotalus tigris TaxID=88082 RepID=UPI00192F1A1A|nr:LIM and calponin homology domains-containing protein 1 isoform X10 [Crotalus tigris]
MASPAPAPAEKPSPPPQPEPALAEARRWIEQVTGKTFGDKHFRLGLENGTLLCELLNSIFPGLVKKINRSPTPVAGLDNIAFFLRGCREVGLKESQLFDPGDLQETCTSRTTIRNPDGGRKLKNVLATVYWLGKTANNSTYFNGPALDLKKFEGLLTQMRKQDTEDVESPKRSIRDSGYIDCWDSERSDSLSPPRHGRDDSFDSLDSFGSRSQQTPSPDVVLRGNSDGRGSDSESDLSHRKHPDVKKDDMSARRTSYSEPKSVVPFNQYLPNKNNQTAYIPAPLRKKKAERDDFRKSWSTMSSPLGGERPFRNVSLLCVTPPGHGAPSFISKDQNEQKRDPEREKVGFQNPEKGDVMVRRTEGLSKQAESCVSQLIPVHFSKQHNREEEFIRTGQQVKSVLATDSVRAEPFCAEIAQSVATQPEYTLEHHRRSVAGLAPEDVDKNVLDPNIIQPEMQKRLGLSSKQLATRDADPLQISGCRTPVSDEAESVSMFDMRCPDEGAVNQPHSKARHEKLQIVHHQLKEDEDQWQDDLARWKTRRRSASQDLLKKEAERKKMEQLLIGGEGNSERRKSIKTYREIVEEKEKRERELHEAYKNASSQEEAYNILQHYIERFTISEAVLERLEMPKLLERSHSAEPNSPSSSKGPNPLQYLRQQSLPAPKFTSTFEATITPTSGSDGNTPTGSPSSSRAPGSMAVPLVTPKPYAQPKDTQEILRNFKVEGKITVNGEVSNGVEGEPDKECSALLFEPSPSLSTKSDHVVERPGGSMEGSADPTTPELNQKRLIEHGVRREQVDSLMEEPETASQKERTDSEEMFLAPDLTESSTKFSCANLMVAHMELSSVHNHPNEIESNRGLNSTREPKMLERGEQNGTEASASQKVQIETLEAPKQGEDLLLSLLKKLPETSQGVLQDVPLQDQKAATENRDIPNRSACWTWDPEEERRRQERWQQDQERLLQERYQKEQEKLKKEWEKAQKEVEEEERKYYEEERKILEDTVVPFMLTSSSAEPLSTSSSLTDGNRTMNLIDLSYSEEDNKQSKEAKLETLFGEQDGASFSKYKEYQPREEIVSTVNKEEYLEGLKWRQADQVPSSEGRSPNKMSLPLCPDVQWTQPLAAAQTPSPSDIRQKDSPLGYNLGLPVSSPKEMKRAASQGNSGTGPSSPRSPTVQSQPSNRSISGKKLCSSCGHPLGKGAAMIIESLGLYFHIQCFRCGMCKGQLGDAATGMDVRIKNGFLTCSDCYNKSRTAGQPTTL